MPQHVGAVVLNGLERPDGPSGLLAHFSVTHTDIEDALGTADHLRTTCQGPLLQHWLQGLPALASRPEEHVFPYRHIVQDHFKQFLARHDFERQQGNAWLVTLDEHQVQTAIATHDHEQMISHVRVFHKQLAAIETSADFAPHSNRLRGEVRALLRQCQRADALSTRHRRQEALLLGMASGGEQEGCSDHGALDVGTRETGAAHFLEEQDDSEERALPARQRSRNEQSRPAQGRDLVPEFIRKTMLVERQLLYQRRRTVLLKKVPRGVYEQFLGFGQTKIHML